jgi:hypothetical protein
MAARTRKVQHDENTRLKIQTSQLVNRLTNHALGKVDLQPTQVKAIEVLLRKTLPDLSSIDGSLTHTHISHDDALSEIEQAITAAESAHGLPN